MRTPLGAPGKPIQGFGAWPEEAKSCGAIRATMCWAVPFAFAMLVSSSFPSKPSSMFILMACAIQWMNFILQLL